MRDKISGDLFRRMIFFASKILEENKKKLNDLNVFPVPDGDTGSNMLLTVSCAVSAVSAMEKESLGRVAESSANAMLRGARGNSGVITSLIFKGIASSLKDFLECDGKEFANALEAGAKCAYEAVSSVVEGTILTVARESSYGAKTASQEKNSIEYVLDSAIEHAEKALSQTLFQNPALKRAGVVDSGGLGWLLILYAMKKALSDDKSEIVIPEIKANADFSSYNGEEIKYGYCTELILKNQPSKDVNELKRFFENMGDSLVLSENDDIIKVHLHTNEPIRVLKKSWEFGEIENAKIENMRVQHDKMRKGSKKHGFVVVCCGEGIKDVFLELGADCTVFGGQTMNPSAEELLRATESVNADNIFILPNNKNVIMTAEQVKKMSDKCITVVPSCSVPQGISAMLAFDSERDVLENLALMTEQMRGVDTAEIAYASRDQECIGIKKGDCLCILNGEIDRFDDAECAIKSLAIRFERDGKDTVTVYYGSEVSDREAGKISHIFSHVTVVYGGQSVYPYIISAE